MAEEVRTTCPYCGTGCGVIMTPQADGWQVKGDPDHPANYGRLCSKGTALAETLIPDNRLGHPLVDGRQVSWSQALIEAAGRIRSVIDLHGPDSFAFYLSGQLLTEDYYTANKLAKGFLGTANVDTNSRLCMASTVAGQRRAFGSDTVPGCYEDLELADLVVLVGSNLAWCHPVLFQRLKKARAERGTKVVVIDPRRTETCDIADLHLALSPGSDVALFNGLLDHCRHAGILDQDFLANHTRGVEETLVDAAQDDLSATGLEAAQIARFFEWFADIPRVVTVFSQGVNQSSAGTDKVNAILNVHLATGRIGKPGMGPFSVTGQPNAMGGREVGGLANQLAAHMGFDSASVDRVRRFWNAPNMAHTEGLKAVDMFHAMADGRIKAVWIMATNPAVSLPDTDLVRRALTRCPVVIVSDCVADTDTMGFAHIKFPSLAWGEKDGTVTNSDRTVSRQRPFLAPFDEARPDWWQIAQVAALLGHGEAFAWTSPEAIYREHAALSVFENNGSRDFHLPNLADYNHMTPFQWGGKRLFGDGRFYTPDGRAVLTPVRHRPPASLPNDLYPLRLNSGRYRDQWHTMTRTGLSPRLCGHRPEPLLDLHPNDAHRGGIMDGSLVRVIAETGTYIARVNLTVDQREGESFLPMHWNDTFSSNSVIGRLFADHTDPVSGQPESKHGLVRVEPLGETWSALLISHRPLAVASPWWVRHRLDGAHAVDLAGTTPDQKKALVSALDSHLGLDRLEVLDARAGISRHAWMAEGRLQAVLFIAPNRPQVAKQWVAGLMGSEPATPGDRAAILAGQAPRHIKDAGRTVCACFSVGVNTLLDAIHTQGLSSLDAIGAALKAGTGCGSCVPELKALLGQTSPKEYIEQ